MNKKIALFLSLSLILTTPHTRADAEKKEDFPVATSPLFSASAEGNLKSLRQLIQSKVDLNAKDKGGYTALMLTASNGHHEATQLLLKSNVNMDSKNTEGQTALYFALVNEHPEIALDLIKHGADIENISEDGDSALIIATTANQSTIMNALIKKKPALVNKANKNSTTPLMEAARFGSAKTVNILLKAGADKKAKNQTNKTALDIAIKAQNNEVIKLLKK